MDSPTQPLIDKLSQALALISEVAGVLSGIVVVTPPPGTPAATGGENPFIQWKADGFDLVQIATWKLHRGLTLEELQLAKIAGYVVESNPANHPPDPSAPTSFFPHRWTIGDYVKGATAELPFVLDRPGTLEISGSFGPSGSGKLYIGDREITGPMVLPLGDYVVRFEANRKGSGSADLQYTYS